MVNLYMSDIVVVEQVQSGTYGAVGKIGHIISRDQARYLTTQHNFEEHGLIGSIEPNNVYFLEAGTNHIWILGDPTIVHVRSLNHKEIKTMTLEEIEAALGYSIRIQS